MSERTVHLLALRDFGRGAIGLEYLVTVAGRTFCHFFIIERRVVLFSRVLFARLRARCTSRRVLAVAPLFRVLFLHFFNLICPAEEMPC